MAIAFDAFTAGSYTSGTSHSFSHSVGTTGSIVHVHVFINETVDKITGVTCGGTAMTLVEKQAPNDSRYGYIYELTNVSAGTKTISITASSSTAIGGNAISHSGAATTSQPDAVTKQLTSANNSDVTTTLTTVADNCWTILFATANGKGTEASTNSTLRGSNSTFKTCKVYDSNGPVTPAGSFGMTVTTVANATEGSLIMVSISPSGAAAPTFVPKIIMY